MKVAQRRLKEKEMEVVYGKTALEEFKKDNSIKQQQMSDGIQKEDEDVKKARTVIDARLNKIMRGETDTTDLYNDIKQEMGQGKVPTSKIDRLAQEISEKDSVRRLLKGENDQPLEIGEINLQMPGLDLMKQGINTGGQVLGQTIQTVGQVGASVIPAVSSLGSNIAKGVVDMTGEGLRSGANIVQQGLIQGGNVVKSGLEGTTNLIGKGLTNIRDVTTDVITGGTGLISNIAKNVSDIAREDIKTTGETKREDIKALSDISIEDIKSQSKTKKEDIRSKGEAIKENIKSMGMIAKQEGEILARKDIELMKNPELRKENEELKDEALKKWSDIDEINTKIVKLGDQAQLNPQPLGNYKEYIAKADNTLKNLVIKHDELHMKRDIIENKKHDKKLRNEEKDINKKLKSSFITMDERTKLLTKREDIQKQYKEHKTSIDEDTENIELNRRLLSLREPIKPTSTPTSGIIQQPLSNLIPSTQLSESEQQELGVIPKETHQSEISKIKLEEREKSAKELQKQNIDIQNYIIEDIKKNNISRFNELSDENKIIAKNIITNNIKPLQIELSNIDKRVATMTRNTANRRNFIARKTELETIINNIKNIIPVEDIKQPTEAIIQPNISPKTIDYTYSNAILNTINDFKTLINNSENLAEISEIAKTFGAEMAVLERLNDEYSATLSPEQFNEYNQTLTQIAGIFNETVAEMEKKNKEFGKIV